MPADPCSAEAFESWYRTGEDPWDFAGSSYEQGRYDAIEEVLGDERFQHGFEPACSVGALTVRLATRCEHLRAVDVSPTAVARAAQRCQDLPQVELAVGSVIDELVPDRYDLVVFSELGYYFDDRMLDVVVDGVARAVTAGGVLVACHWVGTSADHLLPGAAVHDRLLERCAGGFDHHHHRTTPGYVLDAWRRR